MTFCAQYFIEVPDDFPVNELTEFIAEVHRVLIPGGITSPVWSEFGGASNLIGWRYIASSEAWLDLKLAVESHGDARSHEDIYTRERSLFVMFTAGVSCIDSTIYALAAVASHQRVCGIEFDTKKQRSCNPNRLLEWLTHHNSAAQLVITLRYLCESSEWKTWVTLRNRMTHRSNIPRKLFLSAGCSPPQIKPLNYASTSSTSEIDSYIEDWNQLHGWLARTLKALLVSGTEMLRVS